jgi:hypothetical protein
MQKPGDDAIGQKTLWARGKMTGGDFSDSAPEKSFQPIPVRQKT